MQVYSVREERRKGNKIGMKSTGGGKQRQEQDSGKGSGTIWPRIGGHQNSKPVAKLLVVLICDLLIIIKAFVPIFLALCYILSQLLVAPIGTFTFQRVCARLLE